MRLKSTLSTALAAVGATSLLAASITAAHALTPDTPTSSAAPGNVAAAAAAGPGGPGGRAAVREQVAEKGTRTQAVTASSALSATSQQVCGDAGAKWLRVRVADLQLDGKDTISLTSDRGDTLTLSARNWTGQTFYTRGLKGTCVTVTENFASEGSRFALDQVQSGATALEATTVTVAAAGDICGSACNQTRALLDTMNPDAVVTAGDNAYETGTLSEFNTNYDPQWGLYKSKTFPTPGNHEYYTSGASGYYTYFGARAGDPAKGYYSYDVGDWHFVALNSNISHSATSTQVQWLQADLAATTKPCIAAHWHHSRFAAGKYSDDSTLKPYWDALYAAKADLVITGHDHNYLRFAKSKPDGTAAADGIRQLLIGTGGRALYGAGGTTAATIEKSNYNTFGVGKLTLTSTGYTADFVPVAGRTFTDTVTASCNAKGSTPPPPGSAPISKAGQTVVSADSQEPGSPASNVIDGNSSTLWHTAWSQVSPDPVPPHEVVIDLGATYNVDGLRYLPRQDGGVNGTVGQYEVYVSGSTSSWGTAVASGTFATGSTEKTVSFTAKQGRYLKFRALREVNGGAWTSAAELTTLGTATTSTPGPISKTGWSLVYADSQETANENGAAVNAFDGNTATKWHTGWSSGTAPLPHEIQIDMGSSRSVSGFRYLPRQDGGVNGRVGQYEVYVSDSTSSWGTPVATGTFANSSTEKSLTFTAKTGRYLRFRALTEANGGQWTSAAELTAIGL